MCTCIQVKSKSALQETPTDLPGPQTSWKSIHRPALPHRDSRAGGGPTLQDSKLPEEILTVAGLQLGVQATCLTAYDPQYFTENEWLLLALLNSHYHRFTCIFSELECACALFQLLCKPIMYKTCPQTNESIEVLIRHLFSMSASPPLPCRLVHQRHLPTSHIHAWIYDTCFPDLLHSV